LEIKQTSAEKSVQNNLEAIEDSISKGVLTVKFEGKEITYRSLQDMFRVRDFLLKKQGKKGPKRAVGVFSRGLYD